MFMNFYVMEYCFCWNIFTYLLAVFLSNQIFVFILYKVVFIQFSNVFALVSLKISFVLNSRLPGPRWRAWSHIVLEYINENMTFIRLLLAKSNCLYFFLK